MGDFERDGDFGEIKMSPLQVRTSGRAGKASLYEEDADYERAHEDGSVFLELGESLEYPIGPVGPYAPFFLPWTAFAVLNPFLFGAAPLALERGSKSRDRYAPLKSPISAKIDGRIQLMKTTGVQRDAASQLRLPSPRSCPHAPTTRLPAAATVAALLRARTTHGSRLPLPSPRSCPHATRSLSAVPLEPRLPPCPADARPPSLAPRAQAISRSSWRRRPSRSSSSRGAWKSPACTTPRPRCAPGCASDAAASRERPSPPLRLLTPP